jgi:hypothetical protein
MKGGNYRNLTNKRDSDSNVIIIIAVMFPLSLVLFPFLTFLIQKPSYYNA